MVRSFAAHPTDQAGTASGKDSNTIARAALPFFGCLVLCIGLVTVFPQIVTWLPDQVMGRAK